MAVQSAYGYNTGSKSNNNRQPSSNGQANSGANTGGQYTRQQASSIFSSLLQSYGFKGGALNDLQSQVQQWMNQGFTVDTIVGMLPSTKAYEQRFPANKTLVAKGFGAYSPAEYIAAERQYAQIAARYKIPAGLYDKPDDFTDFIAGNVSPAEFSQRLADYSDVINKASGDTLKYLKDKYGFNKGVLLGALMDPKRNLDTIERQIGASKLGAEAIAQGLNVGKKESEYLYSEGISTDQAAQAFQQTALQKGQVAKLTALSGVKNVKQDDLTNSILNRNAKVTSKITNVVNQEGAKFGGSGAGTGIFKTNSGAGGFG